MIVRREIVDHRQNIARRPESRDTIAEINTAAVGIESPVAAADVDVAIGVGGGTNAPAPEPATLRVGRVVIGRYLLERRRIVTKDPPVVGYVFGAKNRP